MNQNELKNIMGATFGGLMIYLVIGIILKNYAKPSIRIAWYILYPIAVTGIVYYIIKNRRSQKIINIESVNKEIWGKK